MCDVTCVHCYPRVEEDFHEKERLFLVHLQRHGISVEGCKWCKTREEAKG